MPNILQDQLEQLHLGLDVAQAVIDRRQQDGGHEIETKEEYRQRVEGVAKTADIPPAGPTPGQGIDVGREGHRAPSWIFVGVPDAGGRAVRRLHNRNKIK